MCKAGNTVEIRDFCNVQDVAFLLPCEYEDKSNVILQYPDEYLSVDKA